MIKKEKDGGGKMENIIEILKVNWRQNLRYHAVGAVIFCLLMPFFFDINGMDEISVAKVSEVYFILLGIICFVPVFLPDQDLAVRNLLDTKRMSAGIVCLVRFLQSLFLMLLLEAAALLFFQWKGAVFPFWKYFAGTAAGIIFLGGIGMLTFAVSNTMPLAYMMPMLYYVMNMGNGKKYLGKWYLNSMSAGSFTEKWYLFFTGILFVLLALLFRTYAGKMNIQIARKKKIPQKA